MGRRARGDGAVYYDQARGCWVGQVDLGRDPATGIGYQSANPVAGPITDQYWRVSWTISGSTPSFTFVVSLGIQ